MVLYCLVFDKFIILLDMMGAKTTYVLDLMEIAFLTCHNFSVIPVNVNEV